MIVFENVKLPSESGEGPLSPPINIEIPADRRVVILCPDTFSQISIVNVLAGLALPTSGRITRHARLSFPVGFLGEFSPKLPPRVNISRAARRYRADADEVVSFVEAVTALGDDFDEPFGSLSKTLQFHIASVSAYAIPFDTYLFSGAIGHPARHFVDKYNALFEARMETSGAILATADLQLARQFFEIAAVADRGALRFFDTMTEAIAAFKTLRLNRSTVQHMIEPQPETTAFREDLKS